MRIGICTDVDNIKKIESLGFDYIEFGVSKTVSVTDEEFLRIKDRVDESSIKCEAFNGFFPSDIKLTGSEYDCEKTLKYIKKALFRISKLGAKVAVIGSGKSRNVPEGWGRQRGIEQFKEVLKMAGDEASKYGITIVIEPLNHLESNIINSVEEGFDIIKSVNHPYVKLLADFYHMRIESEDMSIIFKAGEYLKHLHIANSTGRIYPEKKDEDMYEEFFNELKKIGYDERISIEASTKDLDKDAIAALKLLRKLA